MVQDPELLQSVYFSQDDQYIPQELQSVLLEYVDSNYLDSALCLNSVADHLNASIYAISRTFKDITGVGFKEYVTGRRLQCACSLLASTNRTVAEIAAESGFENATYFTTVFKREFGIPPSKYRTIIRKAEKNQK